MHKSYIVYNPEEEKGTNIYTYYFGFNRKPFNLKDSKELYRNNILDAACADILEGLHERRGTILLTGEVGVGKTWLLHRCVKEAVDIRFILLNGANLDFPDILDHLCTSLELRFAGLDIGLRRRLLLEAVAARVRWHQTLALWIDDAHRLPISVLPRLQEFVDTPTIPLLRLQVVLAGPPELASALDQPEWRRLGNRIRTRCRLERLSELETGLFIDHQLKAAGYAGGELFSPAALRRIYTYSKGVPRAIAILCDTIFLFASLQAERVITPELVDAAAQTCFFGEPAQPAALIRNGQPGGATDFETLPPTTAESANLDLDLYEFDFTFDLNEPEVMSAKQPGKIPSAKVAAQGAGVVPTAPRPGESGVATGAEPRTAAPYFERWLGTTADIVADTVSFIPSTRETPAFLLPTSPSPSGGNQRNLVEVSPKRDPQADAHEPRVAPLSGSLLTDPRIDAKTGDPRHAEWPFEDDNHWIQEATDSPAIERGESCARENLRSAPEKYPWLTRLINPNIEQENPMSRLDQLTKILKNLQNESPGVEASALISEDGLMIASVLPQDLDETRVAGMTATLLNLGTRAATELHRGDVQEVIVRGQHGYSVMISAGRGALLLVLTNENSKLGLIFFDMREAIKAIKNIL
jgi:predicted regulator of Ras-like GTPase activity (Roadblock/LC7/MglB family)/type II secretory pathway predicted ATPase ExeA